MLKINVDCFHYIINALSFSYLFCYVGFTMFLLKPIFKELFCVPACRPLVAKLSKGIPAQAFGAAGGDIPGDAFFVVSFVLFF